MCQTPTARGWVPLDADNFERIVTASPRPVVVVFWGPDCWPCHVLAPTLACPCGAGTGERAVEAYSDRVAFPPLDIAQSPQVAARCGVQGIPHLLFFAQGNVCCHFLGEIPWVCLRDKLDRALSP